MGRKFRTSLVTAECAPNVHVNQGSGRSPRTGKWTNALAERLSRSRLWDSRCVKKNESCSRRLAGFASSPRMMLLETL